MYRPAFLLANPPGHASLPASMAWFYLLLAGLTEIAWAVGLKQTQAWTRPGASLITILLMIASFGFLSQALKSLPIGTAYAIWTGIGAVGTVVVGIVWFGEPRTALRMACIGLILIGIAGLKLTSGPSA
jgi:quaternary ammonium compound-resistance protein SugE